LGVEVIFYGGVGDYLNGELGGVQGLFHDTETGTRFLLDCGQRPDHTSRYYGFPYKPKSFQFANISEFFELYQGLEMVIRHDYQRFRGIPTTRDIPLEILVTHPHYDHVGGLTLARHDIPTHMHQIAARLLNIWQQLSGRTNNQFINLIDQLSLVNNNKGEKTFAHGDKSVLPRDIRTFSDYERFKVMNNYVTAYPVDHSIPGSCGFIVESSAGPIGISGDLRRRGMHPEYTDRFVEELVKAQVKYLFWEGSLLHFEHNGTEDQLAMKFAEMIKDKKFAAVGAPPRDFERLTSLHKAAKATGRILCIFPDQALYLKEFEGEMGYPSLEDPNIAVIMPKKRKGLIDREDFSQKMIDQDYYTWERQFSKWKTWQKSATKDDEDQFCLFEIERRGKKIRGRQRVALEDIRDHPECFFTYMSPNRMIDMLEIIRPPENSIYIRSHPAPWTKDMEIQEDRSIEILKKFGLYDGPSLDYFTPMWNVDGRLVENVKKLHTIHITGHLNRDEAREYLSRMPKDTVIIPYHCMHPYDFPDDIAKQFRIIIPKIREPFRLAA